LKFFIAELISLIVFDDGLIAGTSTLHRKAPGGKSHFGKYIGERLLCQIYGDAGCVAAGGPWQESRRKRNNSS
jgi:hypothetical protein